MFALLNITAAAMLGTIGAYITWRLRKTRQQSYVLYAMRTDGKVVQWDGGDGK